MFTRPGASVIVPKGWRLRWRLVLYAHVLVAVVGTLAWRWVVRLDHAVDRWSFERVPEKAEAVCYVLLQAGSSHTIAIVGAGVGVGLLVRRRWKRAVMWAALIAGCVALDFGLKRLFHRARPLNMAGWNGYSFPSGHVLVVTAVFGMIGYLAGRETRRWPWVAWAVVTLILVTAVALRVPGYHFFSDLVAGYLVGVAWLAACVWALRRWEGAVR